MAYRRINTKPPQDLERLLGYSFQKRDLILQALTHKSAIHEHHPNATANDQSSLGFVGDAVLKYAVARYLFLNGRDDVKRDRAQLHDGAQLIITNEVLAEIARHKLHLEDYLIRANAHLEPSSRMYADCMEAIFGAIALDCGNDQQQVVFRIIAKLCGERVEKLLERTTGLRLLSNNNEDREARIIENIIDLSKVRRQLVFNESERIAPPTEKRCLKKLCRFCLYLLLLFTLIVLCSFGYIIVLKSGILNSSIFPEKQGREF